MNKNIAIAILNINERVKLVRINLNMTQKDFGTKIAVAQNYLSNIEKGYREVTEKIIKIICSEFSVCEEWLRNGTGPMFKETDESIITEIATQYRLGELDKAIMKIYLELSPEKKDAFKDFAFALVDTVLNNEALFAEYREKYIAKNALPFAARGGDTSQLMEAAELFDNALEQKEGNAKVE